MNLLRLSPDTVKPPSRSPTPREKSLKEKLMTREPETLIQ